MRVTTMDRYLPPPGRLVEFAPTEATATRARTASGERGDLSPVPPSFNQRFHLATADRDPGGPRHWLGCSFELAGAVDERALTAAFTYWVRRHEALRSGFRAADGGEVWRLLVPAEQYELTTVDHGEFGSSLALRARLAERLADRCHPLGCPPYLLTAVVRPGSATVFCGFDHTTADGYSLALVVSELPALYEEFAAGGTPRGLPDVGSFVDYCAQEQATLAGPPPGPDHPLVRGWGAYFAACAGTTPAFPLALGLAPGERAAQGTDVRQVLDGPAADAFETRCGAAGGSAFTGALTAFALAARRLGAGDVLRMCTPLHTRYEARWRHAMGWFTTVAPLTVEVRGVPDAVAGAARTRAAFASGRALAELPIAQVLPALGDAFRRGRDDVFMVSFIDYRRFPGADRHTELRAQHISSVTTADDAQFWLSRTQDGLFLRSRFPATTTARSVVLGFVAELAAVLRESLPAAGWPRVRPCGRPCGCPGG
ncbi:condensation domain-containing protein [Streptomyces zagrosensis]|uniref:Condensation domain-containing protein n=1 Tax=Streptomyces zagrosensis TaxID=1042984 RepID=A0A7W9Q5E7_9ACTN|nr:condensation domain-containing protein [Streptomyces zagrosensis]MBB5933953.1 hypothetical protein [Streptomyces zagrosensis]